MREMILLRFEPATFRSQASFRFSIFPIQGPSLQVRILTNRKKEEIPLQSYVVFYINKNNTVLYEDVSFVQASLNQNKAKLANNAR